MPNPYIWISAFNGCWYFELSNTVLTVFHTAMASSKHPGELLWPWLMQPVLSRLFHTIQVSNEDQRQEEEDSWGPPVVPLIKGQHWSPSVAVVIMPLGQLKLSHAKNRVMKNRTFSGLETSRGKGRHILKHSTWIKSPVLPCKSITVYIFCGIKFMFGSVRDLQKKGKMICFQF